MQVLAAAGGSSSATDSAVAYIPAPVSNLNVADMAAQWGAGKGETAPVPPQEITTPSGEPVPSGEPHAVSPYLSDVFDVQGEHLVLICS